MPWQIRDRFALNTRPITKYLAARNHWHFPVEWSPWLELTYTFGVYERFVLRKCLSVLKRGDLAVDVGAYYGYFSRKFAHAVGPTGRVLAVEPHPQTVAFLRANTFRFPQIEVVEAAASDMTGQSILFETLGSDGHTLIPLDRSGYARRVGQVHVETTTLDDLLLGTVPKLVKLDIEGAEPMALKGFEKTLDRGGQMFLAMEFAPVHLRGAGVDPRTFLHDLISRGFSIEGLPDDPFTLPEDRMTNLWCQR